MPKQCHLSSILVLLICYGDTINLDYETIADCRLSALILAREQAAQSFAQVITGLQHCHSIDNRMQFAQIETDSRHPRSIKLPIKTFPHAGAVGRMHLALFL